MSWMEAYGRSTEIPKRCTAKRPRKREITKDESFAKMNFISTKLPSLCESNIIYSADSEIDVFFLKIKSSLQTIKNQNYELEKGLSLFKRSALTHLGWVGFHHLQLKAGSVVLPHHMFLQLPCLSHIRKCLMPYPWPHGEYTTTWHHSLLKLRAILFWHLTNSGLAQHLPTNWRVEGTCCHFQCQWNFLHL